MIALPPHFVLWVFVAIDLVILMVVIGSARRTKKEVSLCLKMNIDENGDSQSHKKSNSKKPSNPVKRSTVDPQRFHYNLEEKTATKSTDDTTIVKEALTLHQPKLASYPPPKRNVPDYLTNEVEKARTPEMGIEGHSEQSEINPSLPPSERPREVPPNKKKRTHAQNGVG